MIEMAVVVVGFAGFLAALENLNVDVVDVAVEARDMLYVAVVHVLAAGGDAGVLVEYRNLGPDVLVCHTRTILTVDIIR